MAGAVRVPVRIPWRAGPLPGTRRPDDPREIHGHAPFREADALLRLDTFDVTVDACGLQGDAIDKVRAILRRAALMLVDDMRGQAP